MKPIYVKDKYQVDFRLGDGGFGAVYQGHDLKSGQDVALKLEHVDIFRSHLENEFEIYKVLLGAPGIPKVYWFGEECEFKVMAFELLGPNLEDLLNYCGGKFSLKTVLMLAGQLISRFKHIHRKGYIHRDVKPENLLMGLDRQGNTLYITDIGLAEELDPRERKYPGLVGTARYASINSHLRREQSARDDLESLGYVLLYLVRGSLPWQGLSAESEEEEERKILDLKQSAEGLFEDVPKEFHKYFQHVRSIEKRLDYAYLRRLFLNLFRREGFESNQVFDWTVLKFLEQVPGTESAISK